MRNKIIILAVIILAVWFIGMPIGIGYATPIFPQAMDNAHGVGADTRTESGSENTTTEGSGVDTRTDILYETDPDLESDDFDESNDIDELNDMLDGFDPDGDFGELGFRAAPGPGVVNVSAYDMDGNLIKGVVITENGFRTDKATSGDGPRTITEVPYGERVFGIYLTHCFEIHYAYMAKRAVKDGMRGEAVEVAIDDYYGLPPVDVSDEWVEWDIVYILRQSMEIKVEYFLVSPNDRFYYLKTGINISEDETDKIKNDESEDLYTNEYSYAYIFNNFAQAPIRAAVYVEMPALKGIRRIRVEGEGIGNAGPETLDADGTDANDGGAERQTHKPQWIIEGEYCEFSMPDLMVLDKSCQLLSVESVVDPEDATFIRYFILTLPSAYEGARFRFERLVLSMEDGNELILSNAEQSYVTVQIVKTPKLL